MQEAEDWKRPLVELGDAVLLAVPFSNLSIRFIIETRIELEI